jgi:hypothetical protein
LKTARIHGDIFIVKRSYIGSSISLLFCFIGFFTTEGRRKVACPIMTQAMRHVAQDVPADEVVNFTFTTSPPAPSVLPQGWRWTGVAGFTIPLGPGEWHFEKQAGGPSLFSTDNEALTADSAKLPENFRQNWATRYIIENFADEFDLRKATLTQPTVCVPERNVMQFVPLMALSSWKLAASHEGTMTEAHVNTAGDAFWVVMQTDDAYRYVVLLMLKSKTQTTKLHYLFKTADQLKIALSLLPGVHSGVPAQAVSTTVTTRQVGEAIAQAQQLERAAVMQAKFAPASGAAPGALVPPPAAPRAADFASDQAVNQFNQELKAL